MKMNTTTNITGNKVVVAAIMSSSSKATPTRPAPAATTVATTAMLSHDNEDSIELLNSNPAAAVVLKKPRRVKGMVRSDGCILPGNRPRPESDGTFRRPAGRQPMGMDWDTTQGLWAPKNRQTQYVLKGTIEMTTESSDNGSGASEANSEYDDDHGEEEDNQFSNENEEDGSDDEYLSRKQSAKRKKSVRDQQKQKKQQRKSPPVSTSHVAASPSPSFPLHPRSQWHEPDRDDGLTLYERNRKPRAVLPAGTRIQRPLKQVLQRFRCVICLGTIRNARMVVECLHRFCEECIDRAMRVGKNVCPICRVVIPSRRSLAVDPNFDHLVTAILGPEDLVDGDDDNRVDPSDTAESGEDGKEEPVTLQQAIYRKRQEISSSPNTSLRDQRTLNRLSPTPPSFVPRESMDRSPSNATWTSQQQQHNSFLSTAKVLDIALFRHGDEFELPELQLPCLRLMETATVEILKLFLQRKLARTDTKLQIISYVETGKPVILTDWLTLQAVTTTFAGGRSSTPRRHYHHADDQGQHAILELFFRREPIKKSQRRRLVAS